MYNISLSGTQTDVAQNEIFLIALECHTSPLIVVKFCSASGCRQLIFFPACYLLNFSCKQNICALQNIVIRINRDGQQLAFDFASTRYKALE